VVGRWERKVDDLPGVVAGFVIETEGGAGMRAFDASRFTDEALLSFDTMMTEVYLRVRDISPLSVSLHADALQELEKRGKVRLVSGSFDDIGNALIERV